MLSHVPPESGSGPGVASTAEVPGLLRYRVRHVTRYRYQDQVPFSHHVAHLIARAHPRQRCRRSQLLVEPVPVIRADRTDFFGNPVSYLALQQPHRELVVTAELDVEVFPPPALDPTATPPWEQIRDWVRTAAGPNSAAEIDQFAGDSPYVRTEPGLAAYAQDSFLPGRPVAEAAIDLTTRIFRDFQFDPNATTITTPIEEVLRTRRGVCQDFAHLQIGGMRSLGLPARYVSGYLRTLPPPGQPKLRGADMSHAWLSVWCGGDDWLDLCPTNGKRVDADFVTLAWGRDYDDVCPLRGVVMGGRAHALYVGVDVDVVE